MLAEISGKTEETAFSLSFFFLRRESINATKEAAREKPLIPRRHRPIAEMIDITGGNHNEIYKWDMDEIKSL